MATERMHGTAIELRDGQKPFRRATLVSEGDPVAVVDEGEIEFSLFEGGSVVIEVPAEGLLLIDPPVTIHRGAWSELRDRPEAEGIVRNIVAPFAEVELHVVSVDAGETVEVYGEAFEHLIDDRNATLRTAPIKRPSRVLASIIAFGRSKEAMDAMRDAIAKLKSPPAEKPDKPPPSRPDQKKREDVYAQWIPTGVGAVIGLGLLSLVLFAGLSPIQRWRSEMIIPLYCVGAMMLRPSPSLANFRVREKRIGTDFAGIFVASFMGLPTLLMILSMSISGGHGRKDIELSPMLTLVGASIFLIGAAATVIAYRRSAHVTLATLLGAARLTLENASGKTGTCSGIATHDKPVSVEGVRAALGVILEMKLGGRRDPDVEKSAKLVSHGRFIVESNGRRVLVDPDECVWSTTSTERPKRPVFDFTIHEWIPIGGKIAVFGRFEEFEEDGPKKSGAKKSKGEKRATRAMRVKSIGTQPAIVFSTAEDDPLATASRIVWDRRITLAAIAIASAVIATVYMHRP